MATLALLCLPTSLGVPLPFAQRSHRPQIIPLGTSPLSCEAYLALRAEHTGLLHSDIKILDTHPSPLVTYPGNIFFLFCRGQGSTLLCSRYLSPDVFG